MPRWTFAYINHLKGADDARSVKLSSVFEWSRTLMDLNKRPSACFLAYSWMHCYDLAPGGCVLIEVDTPNVTKVAVYECTKFRHDSFTTGLKSDRLATNSQMNITVGDIDEPSGNEPGQTVEN
ncbi:hypothetical protein NQZ68_024428 [Dissostichus eleginoides]|nr:hypothetical protein NQZ68_024428 [Dissostichus eleginoides]